MINTNVVYPEYFSDSNIIVYGKRKYLTETIQTYVRKKLEGQYYLTLLMMRAQVPYDGRANKLIQKYRLHQDLLNRFIVEVYKFIKLGNIIPEGVYHDLNGLAINAILDRNQQTERERLS